MIVYLDTSAFVKLFSSEPGRVATRRVIAAAEQLASSQITYAETRAALARKHRMRELDAAAFERGKLDLERDWTTLYRLPPHAQIVRRAGDLAELLALRAYDAIHLATAEQLRLDTGASVAFACFDRALNRAAATLGLLPAIT